MSIQSIQKNDSYTINPSPSTTSCFAPTSVFMPQDIGTVIFGYLEDLTTMKKVSEVFSFNISAYFTQGLKKKGIVLPSGTDPLVFMQHFSHAIGPDVIQEHLGEVENVLPVPQNFIDRAQEGFKLVYIPDTIIIEVNENSPFVLNEETAVNGKKARLIVDETRKHPPLADSSRKIKVPVTLYNIIFLVQKCRKRQLPSQFAGLISSMDWWGTRTVFDLFGDAGRESHWSYQQEEMIGCGKSFVEQVSLAKEKSLEIVSLTDRLVFHFFSYMKSGEAPKNVQGLTGKLPIYERTSLFTPFDDYCRIEWRGYNARFSLDLDKADDFDTLYTGAAVGVRL